MRILVTGASGFLGRYIVEDLARDHQVIAANRTARGAGSAEWEVEVGDISSTTDWAPYLGGIDVVVHLAARVHVMNESQSDALERYREVNARATLRLAQQAADAGVRRLVFLSSIKVNGERTAGTPFTGESAPRPVDPYGQSKLEAEVSLTDLARTSGLEVVILRSPVVYGPGAGGNIKRIAALVRRGLPLPLASVRNRRTMLSIRNLTTWVRGAVEASTVPESAVLMGDPRPVSTPELIRSLAAGVGRRARLVPMPVALLRGAGALLGRGSEVARLVEDLEIEPSFEELGVSARTLETPETGFEVLGRSILHEGNGTPR